MDTEIVLESVKRMVESGLGDDVIRSTLQDFGLSDAEIGSVIAKARGEPQERASKGADSKPAQKIEREPVEEEVPEEVVEEEAIEPDPVRAHHEASELMHAATQNQLDEHAQKVDGVQDSVAHLHQKVEALREQAVVPTPELVAKVNTVQERLQSFESDLKELKAQSGAMQSLLKKILETDRNVLLRLERDKK